MSLLLQHITSSNDYRLLLNLTIHLESLNESKVQMAIGLAQAYLERHAGKHTSVTNTQIDIYENFSQCLIQEVTKDESLVNVSRSPRLYNFFKGTGQLTSANYPYDLDTTSTALLVLGAPSLETLHSVLDEMLEQRNEQGILQVYFDKSRSRIDPVVCMNVLKLFDKYGRGLEPRLSQTHSYVYRVLLNREYLGGTRYYHSAESFLYFAHRFIQDSNSLDYRKRWIPLLRVRLMELRPHAWIASDPLAAAMRIILSIGLELLPDPRDINFLLETQTIEGHWTGGWFYQYPSSGILVENAGLTTALCLKALTSISTEVS